MATDATIREQGGEEVRPGNPTIPPLVNGILVFFYVGTWANLLYSAYVAIQNTEDGNYTFLLPLALYALLFVVLFIYNYAKYRGQPGISLSDYLWGGDANPAWHSYALVVTSLVLIFWACALSQELVRLYFPLIGITLGMFFPWRFTLPMLVLEGVALTYQAGLLGAFEPGGLPAEALAGILISIVSSLVFVIFLVLLIRSRMESEVLVQDLKATKAQLEEALAKEQEVAALRERNRMAREMHDVLGHALVLVAVKIEAAQRLQNVDPERAASELEATKELVRQSMADLRASLADQRSPTLETGAMPLEHPFPYALRDWAQRIAGENGLHLEFKSDGETKAIPVPAQDVVWRVGREAIVNVVKHARATNLEVNLFRKNGSVYLSVGDDGVGIPHLAEGSARLEVDGHYGIRGMRERLEALGGQLTVKPRHGGGTLVVGTIPLHDTTSPTPNP